MSEKRIDNEDFAFCCNDFCHKVQIEKKDPFDQNWLHSNDLFLKAVKWRFELHHETFNELILAVKLLFETFRVFVILSLTSLLWTLTLSHMNLVHIIIQWTSMCGFTITRTEINTDKMHWKWAWHIWCPEWSTPWT